MTDSNRLRHKLDLMAVRGNRRGAAAVLQSAKDQVPAARSANGAGIMPPDGEGDRPDELVVEIQSATPRRRHAAWSILAAAGAAALAGVGALAITALVGDGGASSPEAAVQRLADAVSAEDPLAAAGALAPGEVRTLSRTLDAAGHRAADLDLVATAGAPLAGVDLDVRDLALATEDLAPGYAKVVVLDGSLTAETNAAEMSDLLRRAGVHDSAASVEAAELRQRDIQPFLMAVESGDGWYVSVAYTALEYLRVLNDLPAPDYGSGLAALSSLGASSPEDAARQMVSGVADSDWDAVFSLIPPGEIALYDYREALGELLADSDAGATVDALDATAEIDGDTAVVEVRASGSFESVRDDGYGPTHWDLSDGCLREYYPGYTETGVAIGSDSGAVSYPTQATNAFCISPAYAGSPLLMFIGGTGTPSEDPERGVELTAVRIGDRWFLSPVSMALEAVDAWVGGFDLRSLYSMLGLGREIPPETGLTLGESYRGEVASRWTTYTYSFDGNAGQEVVGRLTELTGADEPREGTLPGAFTSAELYAPDGSPVYDSYMVLAGSPVALPEDGTYTLVVNAYFAGPYELTLWDADEAPGDATGGATATGGVATSVPAVPTTFPNAPDG
ncbi:MAG: hypothetical protein M5T61_14690 [Acidimicrobiia bacterium]|nr:hypothetical protein [Acidimicrobiia bacterium]